MRRIIILVNFLLSITLILFCSCVDGDKRLFRQIEGFETSYRSVLENLTDTLLSIKSLDTNYALQILPKYNNEQSFYYINDNKRGDYFNLSTFSLSAIEIEFFKETSTNKLQYSKKQNAFFLKPFYFKKGDKTLLLVIRKNNLDSLRIHSSSALYNSGNWTYYLTDAW